MGVVYRAEDPAIGREVAIKVVRLDQFSSSDEKAQLRLRLMREASAAGKLNHHGIVTVYQLGEHEDVVYVAMELVMESRSAMFCHRALSFSKLRFSRSCDRLPSHSITRTPPASSTGT